MSQTNPVVTGDGTNVEASRWVAGTHTTASASDTVTVPGLRTIVAAVATIGTTPSDDLLPAATVTYSGSTLTIKTWKTTSGSDPTPTAATTFGAVINWIAVGF